MPSSGFSCGVCLKHAVPHRWFRTVLVPQVRHLGIVTIDAQGILPEKKLVDSRCLRALPLRSSVFAARKSSLPSVNSSANCGGRSEEHTSELQSLMRISYAVFCLKKKNNRTQNHRT